MQMLLHKEKKNGNSITVQYKKISDDDDDDEDFNNNINKATLKSDNATRKAATITTL